MSIYSQAIGLELGMEKRAMLIMKNGKRHMTDGMELLNQDQMRTPGEKKTHKYLGILEAYTIKQVEMKEKIKKEYLRRTRKLLKSKPCQFKIKWAYRNGSLPSRQWCVSLD